VFFVSFAVRGCSPSAHRNADAILAGVIRQVIVVHSQIEAAARRGSQRSASANDLAVFDVDDFKRITDTFGHTKGDDVLKMVAETLKSAVRGDDIVARIGGDEFALVASGLTLAQADRRMRSMMATLGEANVGMGDGHVTVSCGIAEYSAGDTTQSLMARADEAVYEAQRQGKDHIITRTTPYIRDLRAS